MTIRTRLLACLAALGAAMLLLGGLGLSALRAGEARLETIIADRVVPLEQLKAVSDAYAVDIVDTAHKARAGSLTPAQALDQLASARARITRDWSAYRQTYLTPEERQLVAAAAERMPGADAAVATLTQALKDGDRARLASFIDRDLYPAIDPVTAQVSRLVDLQVRVAQEAGRAARRAYETTLIGMLALVGAGLVVLGFSIMTIVMQVIRPLRAMTDAMEGLALGQLGLDVPALDRKDEVGLMAKAVQHFKDAAVEKLRLEAEGVRQRAAADMERASNEALRAEVAQQQEQVVGALALGLERLSAGELTYRLNDRFAPEYESLRTDFNAAMQALEAAMGVVRDAAHGIRSGSAELSHAADDMSRRTEQQAASLEETAAALDQITTTVKRTADVVRKGNVAVATARSDAERSGVVVGQAVTAMAGIEQSSRQISQIIGVIDEIAFQTNLLALNAGVEAARAGDAGRGFAVVASEVRALAQRSAEAAKEIKALIASSTAEVDSGVSLVRQTGSMLSGIMEQVSEIAGLIEEVALSTEEQSQGLQQVNSAVNVMDQAVQQNAAMVEQSTAAASGLAREAQQLAELMARFHVAEAGRVESARVPRLVAASNAPANPPAGRSARPLQRAVGDWTEF